MELKIETSSLPHCAHMTGMNEVQMMSHGLNEYNLGMLLKNELIESLDDNDRTYILAGKNKRKSWVFINCWYVLVCNFRDQKSFTIHVEVLQCLGYFEQSHLLRLVKLWFIFCAIGDFDDFCKLLLWKVTCFRVWGIFLLDDVIEN